MQVCRSQGLKGVEVILLFVPSVVREALPAAISHKVATAHPLPSAEAVYFPSPLYMKGFLSTLSSIYGR